MTTARDETTTVKPKSSRLRRAGSALFLTATFGLAGLMFIPPLMGMSHYVIVGKSMTGTIDKGSLIYDENVPVKSLKVGDIITYTPPAGAGPKEPITHRIVWKGKDSKAGVAFRTKGDANSYIDPWKFTLNQPTQAREAFHVPYVGYALAALSIREVRMALIGIPAAAIAIMLLIGLWRESGKHRDEQGVNGETASELA